MKIEKPKLSRALKVWLVTILVLSFLGTLAIVYIYQYTVATIEIFWVLLLFCTAGTLLSVAFFLGFISWFGAVKNFTQMGSQSKSEVSMLYSRLGYNPFSMLVLKKYLTEEGLLSRKKGLWHLRLFALSVCIGGVAILTGNYAI